MGDHGPAADLPVAREGGSGAEDELLLAVEHGSVGEALRSLSPELRQVLLVTIVDGLSTREAAALLGLPHGTVKSRLRTAKSGLREQLLSLEGRA